LKANCRVEEKVKERQQTTIFSSAVKVKWIEIRITMEISKNNS